MWCINEVRKYLSFVRPWSLHQPLVVVLCGLVVIYHGECVRNGEHGLTDSDETRLPILMHHGAYLAN